MDSESIREYCLQKRAVTESFPFGETALVFKVGQKMFLLLVLGHTPARFNAKCDPDKAIELREWYAAIQPGYHMNKRLWNTVTVDGSLSTQLIKELIDDSYNLVVASLPASLRKEILG